MTEAELADFQANLLRALSELDEAGGVRSCLAGCPGAEYLQTANDEMIEVAAELVKTWGKTYHSQHAIAPTNS